MGDSDVLDCNMAVRDWLWADFGIGSDRGCAGSKIDGVCIGKLTHTAAEARCHDVDAILCTAADLKTGKAGFSTGCGGDGNFVWSSTVCGIERYVAIKYSTGEELCSQMSDV